MRRSCGRLVTARLYWQTFAAANFGWYVTDFVIIQLFVKLLCFYVLCFESNAVCCDWNNGMNGTILTYIKCLIWGRMIVVGFISCLFFFPLFRNLNFF